MPDHQNQSARVVRTRRVCRPIVICVPNMHAKDERPDVLVDAGAAGLGACVVVFICGYDQKVIDVSFCTEILLFFPRDPFYEF